MLILCRDTLFESHELNRDLAKKSVRGGLATMGSQVVQVFMRIASIAILARLLTPSDYGLVGMVTVITNFASMFKDAGLSMATVQQDKITHEQISTLFWLNVLISSGLGLCVLVFSPIVAWFYGKPELTAITAVLSLSFILGGFAIQHQALLRRHMCFGTLAFIQITSQCITLVVTIVLAMLGWRYWALIGGNLSNTLTSLLLTVFFCPWAPGRMQRGAGVRKMLKFGSHLTGFNFINYISRNADNVLVGRFIGADALGLYSRAYNLFLMPISQIRSPISNVSVPALCGLRNEHERYRNYFRKILFIIALLNMPLVGFMLIYSDNIILVMLGKQWYGAVRVFQVLTAVGFIQSVAQAGRGLPLMSMGFSRRYFYFGIIQSLVTVLGIVIGLQWGIVGVAAGYGISFCILIPFTLGWCLKGSPVTARDWLKAIYCPALATFIMVSILFWMKNMFFHSVDVFDLSIIENLKMILLSAFAAVLIYFGGILLTPLGREYLFSIVKNIQASISRRKESLVP